MIESYYTKENGYHPFLIRDHWQVAQLNYLPDHSFTTIERLERHEHTDEIFVMTKGKAVLIASNMNKDELCFECIWMEPGVSYNIPVNTWHNIAMDEAAEIIIVEKSNTHLYDVTYYSLTDGDQQRLKNMIQGLMV